MTLFTDAVLKDQLGVDGFLDHRVTVVDPGVGTGTFLLSVIDRIAEGATSSMDKGSVGGAVLTALGRLIGLEIQAGPYSVTQLRLSEHAAGYCGDLTGDLRVYLTGTLDDPQIEPAQMPLFMDEVTASRRAANHVKASERVWVVIGNPPYRSGAGGEGRWVEETLMSDWAPDPAVSKQGKNLANLYVYFWRWATWKVFENSRSEDQSDDTAVSDDLHAGVVSFIAPTAFFTGPAFYRMRTWLRQWCSSIWVVHLTPEGHHAPQESQIFQSMQQPVGIVTAARSPDADSSTAAKVHYFSSESGSRSAKLKSLRQISDLRSPKWQHIKRSHDWGAPFIPSPPADWVEMPAVGDLFPWSGNGVMVGRTWPIAPDRDTLRQRWKSLLAYSAGGSAQREAFREHKQDRRVDMKRQDNLRHPVIDRPAIVDDTSKAKTIPVTDYSHRSFDRKQLIADKRLINRPNPSMWAAHGEQQVYLTVPTINAEGERQRVARSVGSVMSLCADLPDLNYLSGRGGGVPIRCGAIVKQHCQTSRKACWRTSPRSLANRSRPKISSPT